MKKSVLSIAALCSLLVFSGGLFTPLLADEIRQEITSPKGNLLLRVTMKDDGEGEIWVIDAKSDGKVKARLCTYSRSAEVLMSADQNWIAVNVHPASSGGNYVSFYEYANIMNVVRTDPSNKVQYRESEALTKLMEKFEAEVNKQNDVPAETPVWDFSFDAIGFDSTSTHCLIQVTELSYEKVKLENPVKDYLIKLEDATFISAASSAGKNAVKEIVEAAEKGKGGE